MDEDLIAYLEKKINTLEMDNQRLRESNKVFMDAARLAEIEINHWKANHDNQVKLKREITQRPSNFVEMIKEIESLKAELDQRSMLDDARKKNASELNIAISKLFHLLFPTWDSKGIIYKADGDPADVAFDWLRAYSEVVRLKEKEQELIHTSNKLADELIREKHLAFGNQRLRDELAAAPRWVPVGEWDRDGKYHVVFSAVEDICDARLLADGEWLLAFSNGLKVDVTHVLENLNPPVCEACSDTGCEVDYVGLDQAAVSCKRP